MTPAAQHPVGLAADKRQPSLRRSLNLPLLTLYGLGVTVGAGIYVRVGAMADAAGAFAPFSFIIAAVVVACSAFSYAELATRYPVSAGEAAYVEEGFRSARIATIAGLLVAASGIISSAAIAIGAGAYLSVLTGLPHSALTIGVVVSMGLITYWGIVQSITVAAIITVIEIAGLLFVIFWGFGVAEGTGITIRDAIPPLKGDHWIGIGTASVLAFYAFVGFEDMANVAEEVRDPVRTMPRAIMWTLVLATLLYVATAAAVLSSVPPDKLAKSAAALSLVFANAPVALQDAFAAVAVVATVNGALIQTIMASRVLYGLASRGHLPQWLGQVSPRTRTPANATVLVTLAIIALTQLLPIEALAERTSQAALAVFMLVNLALIRLKLRGIEDGEHFRVPLAVPILGVVTSVGLFASALPFAWG